MHKYIFITTLIFFIFVFIRVKADDDEDEDTGSSKGDYRDSKATLKADVAGSTGDGQAQQNAADHRSNNSNNSSISSDVNNNRDQARNNAPSNSNYGSYNQNNNRYSDTSRPNNYNPAFRNVANNYGNIPRPQPRPTIQPSWPSAPAPAPVSNDLDPNMKDFRTGLSFGTLKMLSKLPTCDQQALLNYRRLLRTPSIRLQFYRDLYQLRQGNYVDGCGEGMVRIGHRERAILLSDPFFRKKVERLMRRQPIGAAIRAPVHYPNDIGADQQQGAKVLTLNKQY